MTANSAKGTTCADEGNPCTKNLCDGSGLCTHPNKKNGITCGVGQSCQDGICETDETDTQKVEVFFGSGDPVPADCFVKVIVTGFAPGTHSGVFDLSVDSVRSPSRLVRMA